MKIPFSQRVEQKYAKLTRSQAVISRFIIAHHEEVPFLSAGELARRIGTSNASITRFCAALGYAGFSDFQKDMQRWLQTKLNPSEQLAHSLRKRKKESIFAKIFQRDLQNLKETMEEISFAELEKGIEILIGARQIYVIGLRSSFALAYLFHHHLSRVYKNVILVDAAYGSLYDPLIGINEKDALLVVTFFRYAKWTIQAAQYAKDKKAKIIALTDSILSPIAKIADIILQVKAGSPAFFNSFTSAICVLNCLIEGISLAKPKKAIQSLRENEEKLPEKEIWLADRV